MIAPDFTPAASTAMTRKAALGALLMLTTAACFAGAAAGQFSVQITLTNPQNTTGNSNACTSDAGAGGARVQVTCNSNVYVEIAQTRPLRTAQFLPGYQQQLASAGNEAGSGREIESQRYALSNVVTVAKQQTLSRLQDDRDTVTTIHLAHTDNLSGSVEMLISF